MFKRLQQAAHHPSMCSAVQCSLHRETRNRQFHGWRSWKYEAVNFNQFSDSHPFVCLRVLCIRTRLWLASLHLAAPPTESLWLPCPGRLIRMAQTRSYLIRAMGRIHFSLQSAATTDGESFGGFNSIEKQPPPHCCLLQDANVLLFVGHRRPI